MEIKSTDDLSVIQEKSTNVTTILDNQENINPNETPEKPASLEEVLSMAQNR